MSPKVLEKYSEFRREQILHASWDCFVELGYKKTTLRTIAKRMNASTGVIYTYFKSKEELIDALLSYNSRKSKEIFSLLSKEHQGSKAVEQMFNTVFNQLPTTELAKIVRGSLGIWIKAMEKKKARGILSSSWLEAQKSIELMIRTGVENGEFRKDFDPKMMAGYVVVILLGLQMQIMLMSESITSSYIKSIKSITLKSLK